MGGIERRLRALEGRSGGFTEDEEELVTREAWTRVTDEDLQLAHASLVRWDEGGGEPTGEEQAALDRFEEIWQEVAEEMARGRR